MVRGRIVSLDKKVSPGPTLKVVRRQINMCLIPSCHIPPTLKFLSQWMSIHPDSAE